MDFCGGYLEKNLSKDSKITVMLMGATGVCFYEIFIYVYRGIVLSTNIEIFLFIKILLIEVIFNTLITIIIYPLIQLVGYDIEEEFKGNKLLTKYF